MGRILDLIIDIVTAVFVIRMIAGAVRGFFGPGRAPFHSHLGSSARPEGQSAPKRGETVRDPVCGMFVSTELSHPLRWHGKLLHFCSEECLKRYRRSASA
jgi:YHS domain-containing protein